MLVTLLSESRDPICSSTLLTDSMLNSWSVGLSEPIRYRDFEQLVYSRCGSYFFCSILSGGGYAAHCFTGNFVDCNLLLRGGVFPRSADRHSCCAVAGSDARRLIAQASGQRLDDGSFDWHASANRLPARIFAGAGNRRPAESFSAGTNPRYRQGLEFL